jgi:hypothetical protein
MHKLKLQPPHFATKPKVNISIVQSPTTQQIMWDEARGRRWKMKFG